MWQRFTERARKVVFYAQEEAQRFGEGYVSTEHVLLGLVRDPDTIAGKVLEKLGISLNRVRAEVEKQLTKGEARPSQDMTLTPRAKRVIDLAYDEARNLNNNYIGTEHLLLGLIREGDGLAARVLAKLGAELEPTRAIVIEMQETARREAGQPKEATGDVVSLLDRFRKGTTAPAREDPRAILRSKLVFLAGSGALADAMQELLRSLSLVPLSWDQAREFTGHDAPTTFEIVNTAFAVGGPIVFIFADEADPPDSVAKERFQDQLFAAGSAFASEADRTIFLASAKTSVGKGLDRHLLRVDNGQESRQAIVIALQKAGCPVDLSGEAWLTAGDFGTG